MAELITRGAIDARLGPDVLLGKLNSSTRMLITLIEDCTHKYIEIFIAEHTN
jgi:hypothetical protein